MKTVLEHLIDWGCRFFSSVEFRRVVTGDDVAVLGIFGALDDGAHAAVRCKLGAEESRALQILFSDLLRCIEAAGAHVERNADQAELQARALLELLACGPVYIRRQQGRLVVGSASMLCNDGQSRALFFAQSPEQSLTELLESFGTFLVVRWPKDVTS